MSKTTQRKQSIYAAGRQAAIQGVSKEYNPYRYSNHYYRYIWFIGWKWGVKNMEVT